MLTDTQKRVLDYLATTLQAAGIPFQATGGLAVIAYGATRPLFDIDLEIHKADVEKVRELFAPHITEDWNNDLEGDDDLFDIWMMKLEIEGVPIDINQFEDIRMRTVGGPWIEQPGSFDPVLMEVAGIALPVQSKESLIAYKRMLGRDMDLIDIEQIT